MRVLLRPEVFATGQRLELFVLLWLGSIGRHRVLPDPLDSPELDEWLDGLDEPTREAWRAMVSNVLQREQFEPSEVEVAVTVGRAASNWNRTPALLTLGAALDLLLQPYRIVLENSVNDRAFVLSLCGSAARERVMRCEAQGWLLFEMGGGSMVVPRVRELRRSPALRAMASMLVDSDAMRPGADGEQALAVRRYAGGNDESDRVHLCVLKRRAIENYLPIAALRRAANTRDEKRMVRDFERLSSARRAHFNMKEGFAGDAGSAARAGDLYAGLDENHRARLSVGFGRDAAQLYARGVLEGDFEPGACDEVRAFVAEVFARVR